MSSFPTKVGAADEALYRDKVYENQGNPALLRLVPAGVCRVLDVGCGAGANARLLKTDGCRVWGLTLSEKEALAAAPFCESVTVADAGGDEVAFDDGFFDLLLLSHVLEHLPSPRRVLTRLSRFLRPEGFVLAAVPNMAFWRMRYRFLRGDWERQEAGFLDRTHLQFWSFETAPEVFLETPFALARCDAGDPAVPLWPLRRLAPSFCKSIDHAVGFHIPNLAATQVLMLARLQT